MPGLGQAQGSGQACGTAAEDQDIGSGRNEIGHAERTV
jgi:hypothetical protein